MSRPGSQGGRGRALRVLVVVQSLRRGRIGGGHRGRRAVPGHPVRRDQGSRRARALFVGRRLVHPHLSAQRHRLRVLPPSATGHRRQQPDRGRHDHRGGSFGERRLAVAPTGPRGGHLPSLRGSSRRTPELVHDEAFNVGRPEDNVQVRDIADMVCEAVPGSAVSFAEDAGPDLRNYRVDFSKLANVFPDLALRWRVRSGVDELVKAYTEHDFTYDDFTSTRFVRLRRISELQSAGLLDDMMHAKFRQWPAPPERVLSEKIH